MEEIKIKAKVENEAICMSSPCWLCPVELVCDEADRANDDHVCPYTPAEKGLPV